MFTIITIAVIAVIVAIVAARRSSNNSVAVDAVAADAVAADAATNTKAANALAVREWLQAWNTSIEEVSYILHSHSVVIDVLKKEVYFQRCGWDYISLGECRDRVLAFHAKKQENAAAVAFIFDLIEETRSNALILRLEKEAKESNTPWYERSDFPKIFKGQLSEYLLSALS